MKKFNLLILLITGILFVLFGLYSILHPKFTFLITKNAIVITFIVISIMKITSLISEKKYSKNKSKEFLGFIVNIVLAFSFLFAPIWFWAIIPIIFGIWCFINSILNIINFYNFKKNMDKEWKWSFLISIVYFFIGLIFIVNPTEKMMPTSVLIGIYFILYGITILRDLVYSIFLISPYSNGKRRFRIVLPIFISAFIPQKILSKINSEVRKWCNEQIIVDPDEVFVDGDLEVLVHISKKSANGFGHCDIAFKGMVISYGTYDSSSDKLFKLFSDGVLAVAPMDKYIDFCNDYENKIIIGFGINLSENQLKKVTKQIKSLIDETYRWYSRSELDNNSLIFKDKFSKDPASMLHDITGAKFYKFKKGKFKTYFALSSNCVRVADYIIGAAGIDGISSGIITPGVYYSYLDSAYQLKNGLVSYKHVYMEKDRQNKPPID